MSDLNAMVKGVLESLDGAGALADMLAELGREREAVLLRRRWKAWQTDRAAAPARAVAGGIELVRAHGRDLSSDASRLERLLDRADRSFRDYIERRFVLPQPPAPRPHRWANHTCRRATTCCCSVSALEPSEDCPIHGGGAWPPRCEVCGRMMRHVTEGQTA